MNYTSHVAVLAIALALGPVVYAQPVTARPFAAGATTVMPLSKAQAKAELEPASAKKIRAELLDVLLESESNEFIAVFADETPAHLTRSTNQAERLSAQKAAFKNTRARVRGDLANEDIEFLGELDTLPVALVRTKHRGALVKLLNHSNVVGVVENSQMEHHLAQSLPLIHQPAAIPGGYTGTNTTVVVIDDGTDYTHPAFGGCTAPGTPSSCRVVAAESLVANTSYNYQAGSHGTNVAAIVASVAAGTRIAALNAFQGSTASFFDVLKGLDWAISHQAQYNIVAVNMSLGHGRFTSRCDSAPNGIFDEGKAYSDSIRRVRAVNILPVVSAGNNGYTDAVAIPACVAGVIAVGATYAAEYVFPLGYMAYYTDETRTTETCRDGGSAANRVACFSNGGNLLTLFAPGAFISAGGTQLPGTSQAAPHVAGAIAVLRGSNGFPNETIDQTQARLTNSGLTVTDHRNNQTKPRLDILGSLAGPYFTVMQQIYIAYYGRPADPGGLAFWTVALAKGNAPTTLTDLERAYDTNPTVKSVVDGFGNSQESRDLYTGTTTDFVTAIYHNVLNRDPDPSGLAWWSQAIDSGGLTRGRAALSITAGAMANADGVTVNKKTAVANNFTNAVDTGDEFARYSSMAALAKARAMLGQVGSTTDVNAFQATVDWTLYSITYQ